MPKEVKKRRKIYAEDGVTIIINYLILNLQILFYFFLKQSDAGWEEIIDYVFPDESAAQPTLKLLELAKKWKQSQPSDS